MVCSGWHVYCLGWKYLAYGCAWFLAHACEALSFSIILRDYHLFASEPCVLIQFVPTTAIEECSVSYGQPTWCEEVTVQPLDNMWFQRVRHIYDLNC